VEARHRSMIEQRAIPRFLKHGLCLVCCQAERETLQLAEWKVGPWTRTDTLVPVKTTLLPQQPSPSC
jgi:hypothetical protein